MSPEAPITLHSPVPTCEGAAFSQSLWGLSLSQGLTLHSPDFPGGTWGCQLWLLAAVWHRGCSVGSAMPVSAQQFGSEINCYQFIGAIYFTYFKGSFNQCLCECSRDHPAERELGALHKVSVPTEMCPAGPGCGCVPLPSPRVSGSVLALGMISFQCFCNCFFPPPCYFWNKL